MNKLMKISFAIGVSLFLSSCAVFAPSMKPEQVNRALPAMTVTKFLTAEQAEAAVQANKGKYLSRGRSLVAPLGFTAKNELKKGAEIIDKWVISDGGNAYVLVSSQWIRTGDKPQLNMVFDTMLYE